VIPAHQGLDPSDAPRREFDLRLVVEFELALVDRRPELVGNPDALVYLPVEVSL